MTPLAYSLRPGLCDNSQPHLQPCFATACPVHQALTRSGEVLTWGTNDYGQLGNGNTSYQTRPCRVAELDHVKVGVTLQGISACV